jgi:fucose 4-O-acetylase-like acetyltransferase
MKPLSSSAHLDWIDVAKGLGIVLVVMSHTVAGPVMELAFLFHMPLFFILSGYLYRERPSSGFIMAKAKSLLVPYGVFLVLIFGATHMGAIMHGQLGLQPVIDVVYGGKRLTGPLGVFWFVTCLFVAQVAYNALANRCSSRTVLAWWVAAIGLGGAALVAVWPQLNLPWCLDLVPVAMGFFGIGHWLKEGKVPPVWLTGLCAVIFVASAVCAVVGISFLFNMKYSHLGPPLIGVMLAAALSWVVMELCKVLGKMGPVNVALGELGRASLVIMFLHQAIHFTLMRRYDYHSEVGITLIAIGLPYLVYLAAGRWAVSRRLVLGKA